jgi:hypothetical protein
VYVDYDAMVLAHARALLTSNPMGRTGYVQADLRDPAGTLVHPVTREIIDFTQQHDRDGWAAVARLYRAEGMPVQWRDGDEFARLAFAGLEMVPPGVVPVPEWRPDSDEPRPAPAEAAFYGGVACKR